MSLHDVDKTSSNRITSVLNSADDVQQRMAQGTNQVQNSTEDEDDNGLRFLERQILAVQGGVNKAIMGFYGEENKFGFKVAEDGTDVLTATNDQLIFNSEQNIFKVAESGTVALVSQTVGAGLSVDQKFTIPHNLGRVPAFNAFVLVTNTGQAAINQFPSTYYVSISNLYSYTESGGTGLNYAHAAGIDAQNFYFTRSVFNGSASTQTITASTLKYYIYEETAN